LDDHKKKFNINTGCSQKKIQHEHWMFKKIQHEKKIKIPD